MTRGVAARGQGRDGRLARARVQQRMQGQCKRRDVRRWQAGVLPVHMEVQGKWRGFWGAAGRQVLLAPLRACASK